MKRRNYSSTALKCCEDQAEGPAYIMKSPGIEIMIPNGMRVDGMYWMGMSSESMGLY